MTWEIEALGDICRLTLLRKFSATSKTDVQVHCGWNAILSSLKSMLETGEPLAVAS